LENDIYHDFFVPYEPQQNGRIKRLYGSLLPNSRAIMEDVIITTNYIHNRKPHRDINNKVPYKLLYNKKVDYNNNNHQKFFILP